MSDVESSEPEIWREIKELEQREADAMLRADVSALSALWSDDLLVNSTANLIADKKILLGVIANGRLRLKSYSRLTVRATMNGDTVITTGNESSIRHVNKTSQDDGGGERLARRRPGVAPPFNSANLL